MDRKGIHMMIGFESTRKDNTMEFSVTISGMWYLHEIT
jgi:hypothetical protein